MRIEEGGKGEFMSYLAFNFCSKSDFCFFHFIKEFPESGNYTYLGFLFNLIFP